jgi:hypothetical protein
MKDVVFWDMTPCGSSNKNRSFGGIYRLHLQRNETLFPVRSEDMLTTDAVHPSVMSISSLRNGNTHSLLTLQMEAICSSETSVLVTRVTRRHIPEDSILHCRKLHMSSSSDPMSNESK